MQSLSQMVVWYHRGCMIVSMTVKGIRNVYFVHFKRVFLFLHM